MWQAGPCLVGDYATTETIIRTDGHADPLRYELWRRGTGQRAQPRHRLGRDQRPGGRPGGARCLRYGFALGLDRPHQRNDRWAGNVDIDVTFHCTETRDYMGSLMVLHNDPCADAVEVPIVLHCQELPPLQWDKSVNGEPLGPRQCRSRSRPSDTIEIIDVVTSTLSLA